MKKQMDSLSNREKQVAYNITKGLSNKSIGKVLSISERTVKFHCANIFRKLNIGNRNLLIAQYYRDLYANPNRDSDDDDLELQTETDN